jgi:Predicted nucleotide-binding protein containing TIR-like domain
MKPRVFIGSSSEALPIANALQINLDHDAYATVWNQNVFKPGNTALESLINRVDKTDFALFVFAEDDVLRMRGNEYSVPRDNVVFETGLFLGKLGRKKCLIVATKVKDFHLPSDFLGVKVLSFDPEWPDENWRAALGPASTEIREALKDVVPGPSIPAELDLPIMERRDKLSPKQRQLLTLLEEIGPSDIETIADALAKVEPSIPRDGLTYRLHHLRLLMFVDFHEGKFLLNRGFMHALERNGPFEEMAYFHRMASRGKKK